MIQDLFKKLSHFRSEMLMSRYAKAQQTGDAIMNEIDQLIQMGLDPSQLGQLQQNIRTELQLCRTLKIKTKPFEDKNRQPKNFPKVSEETPKKVSINEEQKKSAQNVGKWGKKKSKTRPSQDSVLTSLAQIQPPQTKIQEKEPIKHTQPEEQIDSQEIKKLESDQIDLLERNLVLPINMPEFFKNTEPQRLIICYFQKCSHTLLKLNSQLTIEEIIQMDSLDQYYSKNLPTILRNHRILVAPYAQNFTKVIKSILSDEHSILVLYSANNRMLMTQKPSKTFSPDYLVEF